MAGRTPGASGSDDLASFVCPSCGAAVEPSWTYCHVCNYHAGDPHERPSTSLLPVPPRIGPPPGYPSSPPTSGLEARLPPGDASTPFEPAPQRGRLVVVALVVAVVVVVVGIAAIEAVTRPRSNNSAVFLPPTLRPSTTRPVVSTVPGTGVPGSTAPGTTEPGLSLVPVPTIRSGTPSSTPAGWQEITAPDGSWTIAFPAAPSAGRATSSPTGWEIVDVFAQRSPTTGATLRFVSLRATSGGTAEDLFANSATFFATLAQSTVQTGATTTVEGKGARRFVATAAGTPTGALEAWSVFDGARGYLLMSEATSASEGRAEELDLMLHSLRTHP